MEEMVVVVVEDMEVKEDILVEEDMEKELMEDYAEEDIIAHPEEQMEQKVVVDLDYGLEVL